jgi:hypothetical protein
MTEEQVIKILNAKDMLVWANDIAPLPHNPRMALWLLKTELKETCLTFEQFCGRQ